MSVFRGAVAVGVLCLFFAVLCVDLDCVIVVVSGHAYLLLNFKSKSLYYD